MQKKRFYRRLVNISLLVVGAVMAFSGLYIQVRYHLHTDNVVGYSQWSFIHRWSSVLFTVAIIGHIALHYKWFKAVIDKQLFKKNRVTLILTVTLVVVSLLGFVPWMINTLSPYQEVLRHSLVEVHDKVGVFLVVIMVGHVVKRGRWYKEMK